MKPNPHDMLIFLAVVEGRSFTGASQALGLTKSAVSQAVSRLEADIGFQLLLRSTRSLALTDAGARLLPQCKALEKLHAETRMTFDSLKGAIQDTLSVTAPNALCDMIAVPALSSFLEKNPDSSVRLVASDAPLNLIEHNIDVAIRVGVMGPQTAQISKIGVLEESLFASADYVSRQNGPPRDVKSLVDWCHISNEWQGSVASYLLDGDDTAKFMPRIRCNTVFNVANFVRQGHGVALLPDILMSDDLKDEKVIRLFPMSKTDVYALHQYDAKPPAKVKVFVKMLKQFFRNNKER